MDGKDAKSGYAMGVSEKFLDMSAWGCSIGLVYSFIRSAVIKLY